jgi:chromosome segregation ATPase
VRGGIVVTEEFKISPQMKKAELIEEYERLLDAYSEKVAVAEEAKARQAEAEERAESNAVLAAREATVSGVIEVLGHLRGQVGKTLSDLTEQMVSHADRLTELEVAIEARERRLKELGHMEEAADSLAKLTRAYAERRTDAEAEYDERLKEMTAEFAEKRGSLEEELEARRLELESSLEAKESSFSQELEARRAAWKAERSRTERELAEEAEQREKERAREEAEYTYERDRRRKRDEHQYEEHKAAREKELAEKLEAADKDLAERTAAVQGREGEFEELRRQVEAFPKRLSDEVEAAKAAAEEAVRREAAHRAELVAVKHEWSIKVFKEKIEHLEENVAARDIKLDELKAQLNAAFLQMQKIAEKTVEGASMRRAFSSVNEIAIEQARRPEISTGKQG